MKMKSKISIWYALLIAMMFATSMVVLTSAETEDKSDDGTIGLERKLHGAWKGPACGGTWTYSADGTFAVEHYSPGNNKLSGTWDVRWNALPPTLALTIKTSDALDRIKVGETWEVKLMELNDEAFVYKWPKNPGWAVHHTRVRE